MRLIDLIDGEQTEVISATATEAIEISGLTCDSRRAGPGFVFAALSGSNADGRDYIDEAVERGAVAVLAETGIQGRRGVAVLASANPRRGYARMAARFCPVQPASIAAVTGTNGKTSVVSFVRQIWTALGERAASIGTLGITAPGFERDGGLTTPDPSDLHRILADLAARGVNRLAMEASSHGLAQYRLDGVRVSLAGFTNLSRDHLDYHGSMAEYLQAKRRLFSEILRPGGVAVLNADDDAYGEISEAVRGRIIGYGRRGDDIRLDDIKNVRDGQRLELTVLGRRHTVMLPLPGYFQAENAMCALGLALADGGDAEAAVKALETLQGAPGRLQLVATMDMGAAVYVDYAHTPAALANVLNAMRPHAAGKLSVVFGCGGDRDAGKRPQMGRIACDLADEIVVTDDNPRGEDPAAIRAQVLKACPGACEIGDRAMAIRHVVAGLRSGDILIVAGKGHETGQTVKGEARFFDDADEIRRAVREVAG